MTTRLISTFAFLLFAGVGLFVGCGKNQNADDGSMPGGSAAGHAHDAHDHDPHDVPITEADVDMPATYAEAIPRIKSYRDTIRREIEAGTPAKAHRALDELNIVLSKLPTIARDSGVPKEHWKEVNTSAQELSGLFDQVHAKIDEKQEPDYPAVADQVEKAIERLAAVAEETSK